MSSRHLIAENLKRIRLSRQMSQEVLALEAGVDRTYVSGLERGVRNPSVDVLDRLAMRLGVPTAEFFSTSTGDDAQLPLRRGRRPSLGQ